MRPERRQAKKEQNYLWQRVSSFVTCSGSARSFVMRLRGNTEDIPRKISTKRCVQRSSVAGDLVRERFCHIVKIDGFPDQRPSDKAQWTVQKHFRCADAQ